ncbi:MAG: hypothetical protein ACFFA4_08680 [Promethearchaeota archaeon]
MKKTITGLIILGLGIGFPACLGIFLIETQNTEDNYIDGTKPDDLPQKEEEELPKKEPPGDTIDANINFDPNVLNFKSKGKWVTVYIKLTKGYDANDIVLDSVLLNELIPAESKFAIIDIDSCMVLMVKFNRTRVINVVQPQEFCTTIITITGKLIDTKVFEGNDIIELIHF